MNKKILIFTQKVDLEDSILGFFHRWIEEFSKQCEFVTVICLQKGRVELPANVRVFSLGKEGGVSKLTYLLRFYSYIWHLRKDYDYVFVHMNQIYILLGSVVWRVLGKKVALWYAHGHVPFTLRVAVMMTHKVFTSSERGFRLASKKLNIVGQGIDTKIFTPQESAKHGLNENILKVITVGRISKVKKYEDMVDAVEIVSKKNIPVTLEIIGAPITEIDKIYTNNLKKSIQQRNLQNTVVFLGEMPQDRLQPYLSSRDVFVNMSHTGSMDKVVLEAMACCTPAITSNEAFGVMLRPFDLIVSHGDTQALAEKMIFLFTHKNEAQLIGKKLREIVVQDHNLSGLIKKIVERI